MESIWMGIAPGKTSTRVVALEGPSETILKAQLRNDPAHPTALATDPDHHSGRRPLRPPRGHGVVRQERHRLCLWPTR